MSVFFVSMKESERKARVELILYFIILCEVIYVLVKSMVNIGDIISNIVLGVTAVIVWEYTKEAQKSNEIQERPILNLNAKKNKDDRYSILKLKNVGRGPAYNVIISSLEIKGFVYSFSFNEPNFILGAEQSREIYVNVTTPDGGVEFYDNTSSLTFELFINRLFPRDMNPSLREIYCRTTTVFLINYEGVNNKSYYSIFRIYPKVWSMLGEHNLAIEYIESGNGVRTIPQTKGICSKKEVLLKG